MQWIRRRNYQLVARQERRGEARSASEGSERHHFVVGIVPDVAASEKAAAFNITVFSQLLGTPLQPDLRDHVLMLEDVSEHMYRTDRSMFHITSNPGVRRVRGIRLGRCSEVPVNDPDFGETEEEVFQHWCQRSGIPYLGRADIGHDADNKLVPFGHV